MRESQSEAHALDAEQWCTWNLPFAGTGSCTRRRSCERGPTGPYVCSECKGCLDRRRTTLKADGGRYNVSAYLEHKMLSSTCTGASDQKPEESTAPAEQVFSAAVHCPLRLLSGVL